jgi:DNA-binding beta-propeller fold protein YncE
MKIADLRCHAWALAAVVAGCATAPSPNQAAPSLPQTTARDDSASYVYVGECCHFAGSGGNVTLYDSGLTGIARRITKGITTPSFVTVDGSGRLYVIMDQFYAGAVTEYDPGSSSPSRRIEKDDAWALATDSSNNLYVASCPSCHEYGYGNGSVDVYQAGTTMLLRRVTKGAGRPLSEAIDTNDNLYVLNGTYPHPAVTVYAPGSSTPLRKLTRGLTGPTSVALDPSNNLFVMNDYGTGSGSIVEYESASDKLLRTITSGISSPQAIAIDSSGTLYVANSNGSGRGWISVYPPGASTPSYEITREVDYPLSLTVDDQDNLYVANVGYDSPIRDRRAVCVYAANTRKPLRCVRAERRFDLPTWLATGP